VGNCLRMRQHLQLAGAMDNLVVVVVVVVVLVVVVVGVVVVVVVVVCCVTSRMLLLEWSCQQSILSRHRRRLTGLLQDAQFSSVVWTDKLRSRHQPHCQVQQPGYFLGFDSWGCRAQGGGQCWIGFKCLTEERFEGLVYH